MVSGARLEAAFIDSAGDRLLGGLYLAGGPDPRPAALLLHGLPGHEKSLDLAADLRQIGFHSLYFHYRGAWGSSGDFSFDHLVPDAVAALDWLARRPEVDPGRIAVVGFSLGGWVACQLAADRPPAALVAAAPLVDPRSAPLPPDLAEESAATLHGTTAAQLTDEWRSLRPLTEIAPRLQRLRFLLVTADQDPIFPPAHYHSFVEQLPDLERIRFPRADHLFSDVRPGLRHVIRRWLVKTLASA
jgi:dienelactone hydrolase